MFRVVLALVATLLATACGDPQERAARLVAAGDAYVEQGRYNAAVIEYRNALKQAPDSAVAYRQMGRAYEAAGDHGSAYQALTKAVDLDPADIRPRLEAGQLLFKAGMYDAAAVRADQVLERAPNNVDARILAGRALAAMRRVDEGLEQLKVAAATAPDGRAWVAIGDVKRDANDSVGADAAFLEAIGRDPRAIEARASYAAFLVGEGRVGDAEKQLLEAVASAPDDELANRALAALYLGTEREAAAESHLKRAAERPIHKYRSALALADYYAALERFEEARAALSRVSRAETADAAAAQVRLAAIAFASGSAEEGHRLLDRLLQRRPTPEALALEASVAEAEAAATAPPETPGAEPPEADGPDVEGSSAGRRTAADRVAAEAQPASP